MNQVTSKQALWIYSIAIVAGIASYLNDTILKICYWSFLVFTICYTLYKGGE